MVKINEYQSGEILSMLKRGFRAMSLFQIPLLGRKMKSDLVWALQKCEPKKISLAETEKLLEKAEICAIGDRVCTPLHNSKSKHLDTGKSIFLDELARAMIDSGRAKKVSSAYALETLAIQRGFPIIITKVSGKHSEICRSSPKNCIYWNAEKRGVKCIQR